MPDAHPEASLEEIRDILRAFSGPDAEAVAAVRARDKTLTKPPGSLGKLEEIAEWLAAWQGRAPKVERPRVAVFAANHGVAAARPVSAFPTDVTKQMVANFQAGGAAVNQLCLVHDAELRVYEMALDHPTADFTQGPAMNDKDCATAMAYGMMAVEEGLDLICLGEMGIGNTTSASAVCHALYGGEARDWVGPGTGVDADGLSVKAEAVADGVAANRDAMTDGFEVLRCVGGFELAAIAGALIAARVGKVPVILDGFTCTAAAAALKAMRPDALHHCLVGHLSAEPAHRALLDRLEEEPLLDLGMRLGEGSGAAVALGLVKSAAACHAGMATFEEAGVSGG